MAMEFSIGGFNVKGWMVAVALPVLSTVSGGVYFGYDTLNRFYGVEGGVEEALGKGSTNAKQIAELQKSLTKLSNDTARERTANKTFASNQLTTASQAIRKELQEVETNLSDNSVAKMQQLTERLTTLDATVTSRIQTVEQAIIDNDVRGLNSKLAQLATNMQQILEQQKVLLDLRSQVDKATTITDGIGDKLDVIQTEIDDIWKAYDEMSSNPLQRIDMATPRKGKMFAKTTTNPKTGRKIKVSYGQAGKAKDGGKRIRPGTGKGDSYCARSAGQMKKHPKAAANPNSPLRLSRKKWKCAGTKSKRT